jgi:hypothetical protein
MRYAATLPDRIFAESPQAIEYRAFGFSPLPRSLRTVSGASLARGFSCKRLFGVLEIQRLEGSRSPEPGLMYFLSGYSESDGVGGGYCVSGDGSLASRTGRSGSSDGPFQGFEKLFSTRMREADEFYESITPPAVRADPDHARVMRMAMAGILWSPAVLLLRRQYLAEGAPR